MLGWMSSGVTGLAIILLDVSCPLCAYVSIFVVYFVLVSFYGNPVIKNLGES